MPQLRKSRHRGVVTVELAFVIALFFVFVFAGVEFGRLTMLRHTADNAAYEAARSAVVPGATAADAIARANELVNLAGLNNAQIQVTPNPITENTSAITVAVQIPVGSNSWATPSWIAGGTSVAGESTMMTERVNAIQMNAVPPNPGTP